MDMAAIWADASVWVPWALWAAYGDDAVLRDQWPSMLAHVDRVRSRLSERGLWEGGFQFGDWLDPSAPPDDPGRSKADTGVVATAVLLPDPDLGRGGGRRHRARTTRRAGSTGLAAQVEAAFNEHYVDSDGRVHSDCQTVYALAIEFGLLGDDSRQRAGDRLAELVRAERPPDRRPGSPARAFVLDALTTTGHLDEAYALLTQTECPSWLYPVTMGATTVWERWDSMLPDGSVNPGEMTSFNHYALGSVADWLHRTIGGWLRSSRATAGSGSHRVPAAGSPTRRRRSRRRTARRGSPGRPTAAGSRRSR